MSQIGECIVCKNTFTPDYEREMGMMLCQDCYAARTKAVKPGSRWGENRPRPNDPMVQGNKSLAGCWFLVTITTVIGMVSGWFLSEVFRYGNRIICGGG